jgi:rhodanese-related sulfurtransferase
MNFEITPEEVKSKLAQAQLELTLIDVREPWEREAARIEPSSHIPMGEIPGRIGELNADAYIVIYCHHGVRSLNVAAWLRQQGFARVQSMQGGIDRWSRQVDATIPLY